MAHETEMLRNKFTNPLKAAFGSRFVFRKMCGTGGMQGFIDGVGCFDGVSLWVEAKKDGGKLTALQEKCLRDHAAAGGLSLLVTLSKSGQTWTPYGFTDPADVIRPLALDTMHAALPAVLIFPAR